MKKLFSLCVMCVLLCVSFILSAAPYTEQDRAAIDAFLGDSTPTSVTIDSNMVSPDAFLAIMVEVSSGMQLALEVDMLSISFTDGAQVELEHDSAVYAVLSQTENAAAEQISLEEVSDYLTADEGTFLYWCRRTDGDPTSGPIVKALMTVNVDGVSYDNVVVHLRRDPFEQAGQVTLSGAFPVGTGSAARIGWVISWFLNQCLRNSYWDCPEIPCTLFLGGIGACAKTYFWPPWWQEPLYVGCTCAENPY